MIKVYECIDSFMIDVVDDNGFIIDDKVFIVQKDSMWVMNDDPYRLVDGELRLERIGDKSFEWIEISKECLESHFKLDVSSELIK